VTRVALYPGRFDPVTNGHLDIVRRAAALFDQVVVAVFDLHDGTLFSTEERVALFRKAVEADGRVEVRPFRGLVVEFAREQGASFIVRAIRSVTDFSYEFDMALMNKRMAPDIESVYLMASLEFLFVSGTRIREVAGLGADVRDLVPPHVAAALQERVAVSRRR
jgi:pantetheine-phosphate adenylyltransferase